MKKLLLIVALAISSQVFAQSAIIRGEVSPGVYENIKSDGLGNLRTTTSAAATTAISTVTTVTNTSGLLLSSNSSYKSVLIQNNNTTGSIFLNFTSAATTSNLKIGPGQTLVLNPIPIQNINAIGDIASNANIYVMVMQ